MAPPTYDKLKEEVERLTAEVKSLRETGGAPDYEGKSAKQWHDVAEDTKAELASERIRTDGLQYRIDVMTAGGAKPELSEGEVMVAMMKGGAR